MTTPGHVYVLLEPMNPGMVKIGFTTSSTEKRVAKLYGTGRPFPLVVLWDEYVSDPRLVEKQLHAEFEERRVKPNREFFYLTPKQAIEALMRLAAPYKTEPFRVESRVNILPRLCQEFGDIFHKDLQAAELIVTSEGGVQLATTRGSGGDTTVFRRNLDFIYNDDEPVFTTEISAEKNAQRLLNLDELSLIMTTNLVSDDDSRRIDREQNPYWAEGSPRPVERGATPPPSPSPSPSPSE